MSHQDHASSGTPIQAVIFDFGNVISRFDNRKFLDGLSALCGHPAEALQQAFYEESTLNQDYESGRISSRGFLAGISERCGIAIPEAQSLPLYTEIFTPIESTLDLIRRLKPRYRLGLLSNTSPWHFEHAIRTSPAFPYFDTITLSFQVGHPKPSPRIFEDALSKLGLRAEACAYIDDLPEFAEAAKVLGLRGITYITPEALVAELRRHLVF